MPWDQNARHAARLIGELAQTVPTTSLEALRYSKVTVGPRSTSKRGKAHHNNLGHRTLQRQGPTSWGDMHTIVLAKGRLQTSQYQQVGKLIGAGACAAQKHLK
eukprot:13336-Amphidinium_carterae.1